MIGISDAAQYTVVQTILADAGIAALVGARVFDDVPDKAPYPYVSLGPENWTPFEEGCLDGAEGVLQIDIWSAAAGRVECKQILERIVALFNTETLPQVPDGGFVVSSCRVVLAQVMQDLGSRTRHGVIQVELTVERNSDESAV